jgi:hypothetical protein
MFIQNPDGWIEENCNIRENVTFGCLKSIAFENKIDCTLPFLYPQVSFNKIKLSINESLFMIIFTY